jgi:hypothetical protein
VSLGILSSRWTPAKLPGIFAWHDFGDPNSVLSSIGPDTPAANNAQIRRVLNQIDPSIRSLDQTVSADQPLYRHGAVNGRHVIETDGSTDHFLVPFVEIYRNQGAGTFVAICQDLALTSGAANHTVLRLTTNDSSFNRADVLTRIGSASTRGAGRRRLDADSAVASTEASDGNLHLLEARLDWTGGTVQLIRDGTAVTAASFSSGGGNTSDTDSAAITSPTPTFPGYTCELIWLRSILAADERAQLLAYSRAKWGTP